MKKYILLFACLVLFENLHAQFLDYKGSLSHEIEVRGGIGSIDGHKTGYVNEYLMAYDIKSDKCSPFVSASYTFKFNDYLGLGCVASYEQFNIKFNLDGGTPPVYTYGVLVTNASVRGYINTSKKSIKLIGAFDAGNAAIMHGSVRYFPKNKEYAPDNSFVYSPQFGIRYIFSDDSKLALNARAFYKGYNNYKISSWGILVGISF